MDTKYYIVEVQKTAAGEYSHIVYTADTLNDADHTYHYILSFAATSALAMHSATMFTADGEPVKHETYWHDVTVPETTE